MEIVLPTDIVVAAAGVPGLITAGMVLAIGLLVDAKEKTLKIDTGDEIVKGTLLTHGGAVVHPNFVPQHPAGAAAAAVVPAALEPMMWIAQQDLDAATEMDEALQRLEMMDARQSQILEQRYFGGLSLEETASALGVSLATVKRELRSARAWLANELRDGPAPA